MINIIHTTVLYEDIIAVVYTTQTDPARKVKFLLNTPVVYLKSKRDQQISVDDLNAQRVSWVDEEPYLEGGAKMEISLSEDVVENIQIWCNEQGVTLDAMKHGISCFLCNPDNREYTVRRFEAFVEFLARIDTLETQEKE